MPTVWPPTWWFVLTAVVCAAGLAFLIVSAYVFLGIGRAVEPLLTETQRQLQDLGDLAANTIGRAADTVDIVELRVSQAMGEAVEAGSTVRRQALGVGVALASLYLASRIARTLRGRSRRRR